MSDIIRPFYAAAIEPGDLANVSSVSLPTIKRLESKAGTLGAHTSTVSALMKALEAAGHRFHRRERWWPRGPVAKAATEKRLTGPRSAYRRRISVLLWIYEKYHSFAGRRNLSASSDKGR